LSAKSEAIIGLQEQSMFGPIDNIIFDFDGTLVDTMPSVIRGLGEAIRRASGREVDATELVATFGPAPQAVLEKWVSRDQVPFAMKAWLDFEKSLAPEEYEPFPQVEEMLETLKRFQMRIGIFTGRDRLGTIRIAKAHGWLGSYFSEDDMVCGDDGYTPKPNPEALLALLVKRAWEATRTLMVGDHPYDMMAGRAAGIKTAAALWDLPQGSATRRARFREGWQKWDQVDCDLRLDSPHSLGEWIARVKKV
jgi:HAD superfamily hydrolase (TIGR01549 family)